MGEFRENLAQLPLADRLEVKIQKSKVRFFEVKS